LNRAVGSRKERRRGEHCTYANAHRRQEAENPATVELLCGDSFEDNFSMLEREEQIEALIQNLKQDPKKEFKHPESPTAQSSFDEPILNREKALGGLLGKFQHLVQSFLAFQLESEGLNRAQCK
jgi:hypothetical protein